MTAWSAQLTNTVWLHTSNRQAYATFRRLSIRHFLTPPSTRLSHPLSATCSLTNLAAAQHSKRSTAAMSWNSLHAPRAELTLDFTLPTGQSFRWRRTGPDEYTGVVESRVVKVRQLKDDVEYQVIARGTDAHAADDAAVLRNYFNLEACLENLCKEWSERDQRYKSLHQYFPGARVLRQDPVECLFEFICSSNNHISRIHGMVERLCRDYGTPLHTSAGASALSGASTASATSHTSDSFPDSASPQALQQHEAQTGSVGEAAGLTKAEAGESSEEKDSAVPDLAFYAFPTLQQLSKGTEAALRKEGFGYRAKFITGSVAMLLAKPGGGHSWLLGLRNVPYREASEALCELPGIGPKVAACICLFALDKHEAIPVDTHVWQLAVRYYTPQLKGKTMNKKIMQAVEDAFIERFGPWAGWAHNTLFISELATQQEHLPEHLRSKGAPKSKSSKKTTKVSDSAQETEALAAVDTDAVADDVAHASEEQRGPTVGPAPVPSTEGGALKFARKRQKVLSKADSESRIQDALADSVKIEGTDVAMIQVGQQGAADMPGQHAAPKQASNLRKKGQQQQQQRSSKRLQSKTSVPANAARAAVDTVLDEAASALNTKSG